MTGAEGSGSVAGGGSSPKDADDETDGSFVSMSSGIDMSGIEGLRPMRISRSDFIGARGASFGISGAAGNSESGR